MRKMPMQWAMWQTERERPRGSCPWWRKNSRLFRLQKNGPITPAWKLRQGQEWNDKGWNTLQEFCTIIFLDLQSRLVTAKWNNRKSVPVWRSKLTDSTENYVVEHRVQFLASDYESIQLEDIEHVWYFELILEHILLLLAMRLLAMRCMFLQEFVLNNLKVW